MSKRAWNKGNGATGNNVTMAETPKPTTRKSVMFACDAPPNSTVCVAGTFNNWNTSSHKLTQNGHGNYVINVPLDAGRHEYKFLVNGMWQVDPRCQRQVPNQYGSLNSVVEISAT